MRVLDLFSGIGGFSLGLERAGMRTVAFCEIEPYCRAVLAKHWPGVPCFPDIRGIDSYELGRLGGIDLICGGFPCQDISLAGKGAGLAGERSGLWSEYARLIGLARPRYVVVENVSALLSRGLDSVLGDLAAIGYDAEWHCVPASYVGAPHRRDRVWIVAYPGERGHGGILQQISELWRGAAPDAWGYGETRSLADSQCSRWGESAEAATSAQGTFHSTERQEGAFEPRSGGEVVADANEECEPRLPERETPKYTSAGCRGANVGDSYTGRQLQPQGGECEEWGRSSDASWWESEPDVGRVAHGVPARVDRLKALGNAVVPQVVEIIGRAIMSAASTPPKKVDAP